MKPGAHYGLEESVFAHFEEQFEVCPVVLDVDPDNLTVLRDDLVF